jgi:lipid II:glycine glycyltransferase (peptidoglycan interpeptide bridge formation enzyme)
VKDFGKRSGWQYIELRGGRHLLGPGPESSSYYSHAMQLTTDTGALLSRLKSRNRRNIKKAQREGIQVSRQDSLDAVDAFYRIHCMTRKKHGVPPQPRAFFNNIYRHVIARKHGSVFLASYQGTPIAGAVYLHFGKEAIYKFGASCEKYLPLRPNDLVMWEAIQWYARHGYSKFSLGRTDVDNEGLRAFKTGWGAQEEMLGYFTYDIGKRQFLAAKRSSAAYSQAIFKRVPIGISKLVGKAFYRHVG